jgi:hypothetical protein
MTTLMSGLVSLSHKTCPHQSEVGLVVSLIATAQAPYSITVKSTQYKSLLDVYNADPVSNSSKDGEYTFKVQESHQDLVGDYSNQVAITYMVDAKSQVPPLSSAFCRVYGLQQKYN